MPLFVLLTVPWRQVVKEGTQCQMKANAWLKFYPQDWRADEKLRMCSLAARGLWIEILALMHKSERYGLLLISEVVPNDAQLAVQVGAPPHEVTALLAELESAGVFSRAASGAIYSRRMKRDEKAAKNAVNNGKRGGNPNLCKTKGNPSRDNPPDKPPDKGGVKAQKPEARKNYNKPISVTAREAPPPGITDPGSAFEYVCREADWRPANDTQRQDNFSVLAGWLALGCSLETILAGIARARARQPGEKTRSLKRFDSTIRGIRSDQLGGELPVTAGAVHALTSQSAKRMRT